MHERWGMNWRRGLLRVWIALAACWIAYVGWTGYDHYSRFRVAEACAENLKPAFDAWRKRHPDDWAAISTPVSPDAQALELTRLRGDLPPPLPFSCFPQNSVGMFDDTM